MKSKAHLQKHAIVFALFCWAATFVISTFYPMDRPVDEVVEMSFASAHAWVAAQAMVPILLALFLAILASVTTAKVARVVRLTVLPAVPILLLADCITFHWIGERFLSATMWHITMSLLPGLLPFLGWGTIFGCFGLVVGLLVGVFVANWLSQRLANRWSTERPNDISPTKAFSVLAIGTVLVSIPALLRRTQTVAEMREHSIRHPLCAFHVVGYRSVGVDPPHGADAIDARLHGLALADPVKQRLSLLKSMQLADKGYSEDDASRPDVLIVIFESLQLEMLNDQVMPNTFALGQRGLILRQHFSGGNASNLGIFSLLNGMEATWFPQSDQFVPVMNQLFHQAGYEIGFYGGTDDWAKFGMGGFVKPDLFDRFEIEPVDWLDSDQRSIDRAKAFLGREDVDGQIKSNPRAAVVYLYSSHSPFRSLPDQEIFQPAAGPVFIAPYPDPIREKVWNRYRNSVRSLDHLIKPLLSEDQIIVVAGDHGEAFLEDGTVGHGTRMSKIQNMTPAMIYAPGMTPREIRQPTSHADVLPTLLAYMGMKPDTTNWNGRQVLQGDDLLSESDESLALRVIATCHYMGPELMLIGRWTSNSDVPFAFRHAFSTARWKVAALNPVDEKGLEWGSSPDAEKQGKTEYSQWLLDRYGVDPTAIKSSRLELFSKYLSHPATAIRLETLDIASSVESPTVELLDLLEESTVDKAPKVRELAREVLLLLQRRRGQR